MIPLVLSTAISLAPVALPAGQLAAQEPPPSMRCDRPDVIRPGDVIRLRAWRAPEYSGEFDVSERGVVVVPRLGALSLDCETEESLRDQLVRSYSSLLNHSAIEVTLLRRVQVLGAVRNPGLYPVDGTMTVSDVIALAGGSSVEGRRDRVHLVREGTTVAARLDRGARLGDAEIRSGDQLYIPERNWVSRNSTIVASGISASVGVVIALLLR